MDIHDSQRIKEIRDNTAKMADAFTRIAYTLECLVDLKTDSEIPKNALRSTCTGCRFVGTYDTQFPCANCVRKNKDYYDSEYMEGSK